MVFWLVADFLLYYLWDLLFYDTEARRERHARRMERRMRRAAGER